MKKTFSFSATIAVLSCALAPLAFADQVPAFLDALEKPRFEIYKLHPENLKSMYVHYDFSKLLKPGHDFLAYRGDRFDRMKIDYLTVTKKKGVMDTYEVKGTSTIGTIETPFTGTIKIDQIREYARMHFGADANRQDAGFKSEGVMIGTYDFREDPKQKMSGVLHGVMVLNWYVDKNGEIRYDDIESYSNTFRNNQYVGTWTANDHSSVKTANWGENRIPFSGDLDIGTSDFKVNPKYLDRGW